MKLSFRLVLASMMFALLVSSCAVPGYFVPPRSATASPAALAFFSETTPFPTAVAQVLQVLPSPTPPPFVPQPTGLPQEPPADTTPVVYTAQAADTLAVVAVRFGVLPSEIGSPEPISPEGFIRPGQQLFIPRRLANTTSPQHLLPDSEVVFSPSAIQFDITAFAGQAGGKLSAHRDWLESTGIISGADVIKRVATENSINPRLLLGLLEYQSGWVYGQPENATAETYPLGFINPSHKGLYNQLVWAVNQLSIGYYAYREGRLTEIRFADGVTARLAPDLNAGSAALQYFFAQLFEGQEWLDAIDPETGFPALYESMFGDPWLRAAAVEPLFPANLTQPRLTLPFKRNWLWSYTGGPHGAWEHDGAYAALDFAPGSTEPGCAESNAWVTASAAGLVVRSGNGVVVLDLDGDGYEQTGWVLLYLHLSSDDRAPVGTWVDTDDLLGHPSCEGGYATGTHIHIARKYNGEWIPADGPIPFNLGGWIAHAGEGPYKGTLTRDGETVTACTCASHETRILRSEDDP